MRILTFIQYLAWLTKFSYGRSLWEGQGRQNFSVTISQKPCTVDSNTGTCMFNQDCLRHKGAVLGTCLDGFIFGACCKIQKGATLGQVEDDQIAHNQEEDPMGILKKIDQLLKSFNKSGLILPNGVIKDLNEEVTTLKPVQVTEVEVDQENIEQMMSSIFDNVIQQFDNKLPNLLNELSDEEEVIDEIVDEPTTLASPLSNDPDNEKIEILDNDAHNDQESEEMIITTTTSSNVDDRIAEESVSTTSTIQPSLETTTSSTTTSEATTTTLSTTSTSTLSSDTPTGTPSSSGATWDYRTDCGVRPIRGEGRIVGGTKSQFGDWPWQVLVKESTILGLFTKNKCGGVLISDKHVLTAAHCQPGFLASLIVELGEYDISGNTEYMPTRQMKVKRVVVHKDYQAPTFENDIAILELESDISREPHIVPICMPISTDLPFEGKPAIVTGWGRLEYGGNVPNILHQVTVPIIDNEKCQSMFTKSGHKKIVRESFLCAGYDKGEKDSCEGDSGGPLMMQRSDKRWVLAGTVSHGIKCAYPDLPGVYMRMTFYKPWIEKVTGITFEI